MAGEWGCPGASLRTLGAQVPGVLYPLRPFIYVLLSPTKVGLYVRPFGVYNSHMVGGEDATFARGPRLRVLVADDHPSIRENLRYLLNAESDIECVGVVKEPLRCVEISRELAPDVLVLDEDMPGIDGLAIVRALAREAPDIRIVMYTFDLDVCDDARAAGAVACIAKHGPYEALLRAIRAAGPRLLLV